MRVAVNPGLNVSADAIRRYDMIVLPQHIIVDGAEHDTRVPIAPSEIDRWVRTAKTHPHLIGTSAGEMVDALRKTAAPEVIMVTASTKVTGTYRAAVSAEKSLRNLTAGPRTRLTVIDSGSADLGAGFGAVFAAHAAEAGLAIEDVTRLTKIFFAESAGAVVPRTLDFLVKSGRATFLRSLAANVLDVSPVLIFNDGEITPAGRTSRANLAVGLVDTLLRKIPRGERVWAAVVHGKNDAEGQKLVSLVASTWKTELLYVQQPAATTYLILGAGAIGLFLSPIDTLGWSPPRIEPLT